MANVHPLGGFAQDLQYPYPYRYTFIEPNYGDVWGNTFEGGSSQHPMDSVTPGEALIKQVYEAIRKSPVWNNSLLFITYDEHGGFYDSVPPPTSYAPNDGSPSTYNTNGFDFKTYGVRVPAVVVSPYIPAGSVWPAIYDHTSILKTLELWLGLPALTQRDQFANGITSDNVRLTPTPRMDCPVTLNNPAALPATPRPAVETRLISAAPQPLPESGNTRGFLTIALKTELELSSGNPQKRAAIIEAYRNLKTGAEAKARVANLVQQLRAAKSAR